MTEKENLTYPRGPIDVMQRQSTLTSEIEIIKEDMIGFQGKYAALKKENAHLNKTVGVMFKRLANGGFLEKPFCPVCFNPMQYHHETFPLECTNKTCDYMADFTGGMLDGVFASLVKAKR